MYLTLYRQVGKSSLINRLLQGVGNSQDSDLLEVGDLTRKGSFGAHTTSNARLLRIHIGNDSAEDNESDDSNDDDDDDDDDDAVDDAGDDGDNDSESGSEYDDDDDPDLFNGSGEAVVIDSPGIRDLHLWHLDSRALRRAFPEIEEAACRCRYRNCSHEDTELGCAVQEGLRSGSIEPSRMQSFISLLEECKR